MDDVEIETPETTDILQVMQRIRDFDLLLNELKAEEENAWM